MFAPARLPRALRIAAYLTCLAGLSWLSLAPAQTLPTPSISDKLQHGLAYAGLTAAGLALFARHPRLAIGFAFVYGAHIEIVQAIMGLGREADWLDAGANGAGVLTTTLIYALWRRRQRAAPAAP